MNALAITLIVLIALGTLFLIADIGKPRRVITPGTAVISVVLNAALIVWILAVAF